MSDSKARTLLLVVVPAAIFGSMVWSGIAAWNAGEPPAEWSPLIVYGSLYLLLSYVPTVGRLVGAAPATADGLTRWQRAFCGVAVLYLAVGLAFLSVNYWGILVVGNVFVAVALLGILGYDIAT